MNNMMDYTIAGFLSVLLLPLLVVMSIVCGPFALLGYFLYNIFKYASGDKTYDWKGTKNVSI